ncbi:MAG: hypothetical protein NVV74_03945 [Magnetospirillum sp.]|nr:hypothetical protein [Magnetospirillum sp.]
MARRREVAAGQRYQPTDSSAVWEVRELVKDAEGIVHARMARVGDATALKMISASALKDARLYKLLPNAEEPV